MKFYLLLRYTKKLSETFRPKCSFIKLIPGGVEGRVVSSLLLPLAVEVVGHQVDEVEVLADAGHVVAVADVVGADGHRGRQEQPLAVGLLRLVLEGLAQLLDEADKVLLVVALRVLPVDIQAVKLERI
jgi:hypothetical protein